VIRIEPFGVETSRGLVNWGRHFGGVTLLPSLVNTRTVHYMWKRLHATYASYHTLNKEAQKSSETPVTNYQSIWRPITEDTGL